MPELDYSKQSHMSDAFHEWLDLCPVQWVRENHDENGATYWFQNE